MNILKLFLLITLLACASSRADVNQDGMDTLLIRYGQATFHANVDGAIISIDGVVVGSAPITVDSLMPGSRHVKIVHPERGDWMPRAIEDTIQVEPDVPLLREYRFEPRFVLRSDPYGAEVQMGDSVLGTTPLELEPSHDRTVVTLTIPGYEAQTTDLADATPGIVMVRLRPLDGVEEDGIAGTEAGGPGVIPLVLSGASAIIAGGISAHFKANADEQYDRYLQTADLANLDETRRLDGLAAVSLIASQISLGLFVYLLVSP